MDAFADGDLTVLGQVQGKWLIELWLRRRSGVKVN
jgi:hypothetical protein